MSLNVWSEWKQLPNPIKGEYLSVPISPGVYQIRNRLTSEYVLFGRGENLAFRFCSLFPKSHFGKGTRNNIAKVQYIEINLNNLEYRIMAKSSVAETKVTEKEVKRMYQHIFEPGK